MKYLIKQPTYYKEFKCDGVNCEDSCCMGWNIWIDKKHYDKLRNLKNKELKYEIKNSIKRYKKEDKSFDHYAEMQINKLGQCPFLTKDKLCNIQLNCSEDMLPNVCRIYPREVNLVNKDIERSISVSCPIAAEMILFDKDGIKFEEVYGENEFKNIFNGIYNIYNENNYLEDLRTFSIQIMKSRDYEIWERLIILGMFIERIDKLIADKNFYEIRNVIEVFTNLIVSGAMKDVLQDMPTNIDVQIKLLKEILDERFLLSSNIDNKDRYMQSFMEAINALGYDEEYTFERVKLNYNKFFEEYMKNYLIEKDYVFENLIVNHIFKKVFPFEGDKTPWSNYVMIILHYSLIKMLLTGLMAYHKENFNDKITLKLIQSFERNFEHNSLFKEHIYNLITKNNFDTMAYMAILIKN
ncbi:flagellar biosynthetic protein FliU [Clostridium acetireducens DSM 10703]|uniref:Flagellar biosynthetic protein FliU n=1 Tax=Clostridium acetireducens DSM 10703 TaxID=1121290 RepID=A0A1E8EZC6_9CLOT|nr:flagellin lysine-N-methylase [Clostridium acetireducens]OFI06494.1 flagellar biosynthetic protein FliU [Clostridium acetireducens DSM 10703]